jgi:hypothetical protein
MTDIRTAALALALTKKTMKALPPAADGRDGAPGASGPAGADGAPGPRGPQGYGFTMVGAYQEGATYYGPSDANPYYQVVTAAGSSYAATDPAGVSGRPPGSGWMLLAAKGNKGDRGGGGGGAVLPELGSLAYVTPTGTPDGTKYLRDDGSWQTVSGGGGGLTNPVSYVDFTASPGVSGQPRRLMWNATDGTLDLGMNNGSVTQQIGLEQFYRVKASSAITNGQCVMFTGTNGNSGVLLAAPVSAPVDPQYIMGVATENMAQGEFGFVTWFGKVRGIQTNGANHGETWVDGTVLFANPTIPGGMTSTRPDVDPIIVAVVVNAHASNGEYFVRVTHDGVRWDRVSGKPTLSYQAAFNATTSWSGPSAGVYSVSVPASTHNCGTAVAMCVYKDNGDGTESLVGNTIDDVGMVNAVVNQTTGDVTLKATVRFAGRIVITRTSSAAGTEYERAIHTITTDTTLTVSNYTVLVDSTSAPVTVTLPDATTCPGRVYNVKRINAGINDVIVSGSIDGGSSVVIEVQYTSVSVQSNGTSWWVI